MGWQIVRYIELGLIDTGLVIICVYCRYLSNWRITRFLCSDCKRVLTSLQRVFRDDVIHTMLKVISISVIFTVSLCYINVWYEVAQLCSYFVCSFTVPCWPCWSSFCILVEIKPCNKTWSSSPSVYYRLHITVLSMSWISNLSRIFDWSVHSGSYFFHSTGTFAVSTDSSFF